jgi:putative ABC transport system permease protein
MKANARGVIEGSKFGIGKSLVVAQVALSLLLVVGAGLMLSTFFRLETLDAGFDREHVLIIDVDVRAANLPRNSAPPRCATCWTVCARCPACVPPAHPI